MSTPFDVIYLDMDQVIADFDRQACLYHGIDPEQLKKERTPYEWSLIEPFSRIRGDHLELQQFWKPINEAEEYFWTSIDPLPWWKELIQLVNDNCIRWFIVTDLSITKCPWSFGGKIKWLHDRLGKDFDRIIPTAYKHHLAKEGRLLIDDNPPNTSNFYNEGGKSWLFPSHGNIKHGQMNNPLETLKEYFSELRKERRKQDASHI